MIQWGQWFELIITVNYRDGHERNCHTETMDIHQAVVRYLSDEVTSLVVVVARPTKEVG